MDSLHLSSIVSVAAGAALVSALITAVSLYYRNIFSYWESKGIKGPKPTIILGNALSAFKPKNPLSRELERVKRYGKVYGTYLGKQPILVVADPEVLAQICIKDFDAFPNHVQNEFANKYNKKFLVALRDDHWRSARALISPTFTSGKMKRMFKFMDTCADDLVEVFREQLAEGAGNAGASLNVKELYNLYTFDAITTCCYGIRMERKPGATNLKALATRNDFVALIMKLFAFKAWRLLTGILLPATILRYFDFEMNPSSAFEPLLVRVRQMIASRKSSDKKFEDYLQLLIDARIGNELELNEMDLKENHHAGLTQESIMRDQKLLLNQVGQKRERLDDMEIISNAAFLMLVGLETTGSLLTHCTYALAFNPDVQAKLVEEVMKLAEFNEEKKSYSFEYETLTSCAYLDAVLSETLRLLSPVISFDRQSNRPYRIDKYKLDLPKDSQVQLAYYAIHNDPDYWPEPAKFDPERFMPHNRDKIHPHAYAPFGLGPRHCIGMRFSLTEAKLALAKIVANFELLPAPGTSFPPAPRSDTFFLLGLKSPVVLVRPRANCKTDC